MAPSIYFENYHVSDITNAVDVLSLKKHIFQQYGISPIEFYVTINGKRVPDAHPLQNSNDAIRIFTRLVGGKGGFGSMLRSIGAQIQKTSNREACRDLSGRRLRDIHEEKRLLKWFEGQADREKEAMERKLKKLDRLMLEPKTDVTLNDPIYEKERQELPERVTDAVNAGLRARANLKRKSDDDNSKAKKKKKLWIDAEMSECSSSDED